MAAPSRGRCRRATQLPRYQDRAQDFQDCRFARLAVDLRSKGLPPERWAEFMHHRLSELPRSLSSHNERRRWSDACLPSYLDALDDMDALVLAVSQPQGRAKAADFRSFEKPPSAGGRGGGNCRGGATCVLRLLGDHSGRRRSGHQLSEAGPQFARRDPARRDDPAGMLKAPSAGLGVTV
jgi:hypothetical protein